MTRYPKNGRGRKWTTLELRAITAEWAGDTLSDGGGLSGEVRVAADGDISIRWKYAFKWLGKIAWHQCGTWPKATMEAIRANRDDARKQIGAGVNPNDQKKAERIENQAKVEAVIAQAERERAENLTVQDMFDAWVTDGVARKDGNAEIRRLFAKDVLPALGAKPVREVTEHDLRGVLRAIVARGVNRTAVRARNDITQMFGWAERRQPWRGLMPQGNPALLVEIEKIVSPEFDLSGERERVLSDAEVRELRDIFTRMEAAYAAAKNKYDAIRPLRTETQLALWISLSTACRIGELLMSEWRHVNLDRGEWFIPKENVKGARGKKQDHLVFLSDFALRQFRALHAMTKKSKWCFPARDGKGHVCVKSVSKQIGDRQERFKNRKPLKNRQHNNTLVLAGGANGDWVPHDMRRTAATWMQALRISPEVIDRCQNHVMKGSRVRRHYLHHDYAEEKREAWRLLGDRIDAILADNVVILPARGAA